ncbi:hypothetical protein [Salmonella phage ST3]|uniref:Uncharacterized protein n=1 Tax=Salmonella phage ST3 TaxID=2025820 RepID=A0A5Q2FBL1_9CAUD|nr:hypothetical protein [Salmonella phage ST-3]
MSVKSSRGGSSTKKTCHRNAVQIVCPKVSTVLQKTCQIIFF